jgi:tetratricopeptide (TPR) repeat protein
VISTLKDQVWDTICSSLSDNNLQALYVRTETALLDYLEKIRQAPLVIVDWVATDNRCSFRLEEITDLVDTSKVKRKIVVVASNARKDEISHLRDLGIRHILHYETYNEKSRRELLLSLNEIIKLKTNQKDSDDLGRLNKIEQLSDLIHNFNPESENEISHRLNYLKLSDNTDERHSAQYLCAIFLMNQGKYEDAKKELAKLLEKQPNNNLAWEALTRCYVQSEDFEEALRLVKNLTKKRPTLLSRKVLLADIYRYRGDFEKSAHHYDEILELCPAFSPALNGKAQLLFAQNQLDQAKKTLSKSSHATKVARQLNRMGINMVSNQEFAQALEHYKKAQFILPSHEKGALIFYNIALCYSKWGKPQSAVQFARLAVAKDPDYEKAKELLFRVAK